MAPLPEDQEKLNNQLRELAKFIVENFIHSAVELENPFNSKALQPKSSNLQKEVAQKHELILEELGELFRLWDKKGTLAPIVQKMHTCTLEDLVRGQALGMEDYEAMMAAVLEAFDNEEIDASKQMVSLVTQLFPFQVQPYIFIATLLWREGGIDKALSLYEYLIQRINHPILFLYAAECFAAGGDLLKGNDLLVKASKLCDDEGKPYESLKKEIEEVSKALTQ